MVTMDAGCGSCSRTTAGVEAVSASPTECPVAVPARNDPFCHAVVCGAEVGWAGVMELVRFPSHLSADSTVPATCHVASCAAFLVCVVWVWDLHTVVRVRCFCLLGMLLPGKQVVDSPPDYSFLGGLPVHLGVDTARLHHLALQVWASSLLNASHILVLRCSFCGPTPTRNEEMCTVHVRDRCRISHCVLLCAGLWFGGYLFANMQGHTSHPTMVVGNFLILLVVPLFILLFEP